MYQIIKADGIELGITDNIIYIKVKEDTGNFIPCLEEEAIGVAFNGTPYNLIGHNEIAEAETVIVSEIDNGDLLTERPTYTEMATAIKEGVNLV